MLKESIPCPNLTFLLHPHGSFCGDRTKVTWFWSEFIKPFIQSPTTVLSELEMIVMSGLLVDKKVFGQTHLESNGQSPDGQQCQASVLAPVLFNVYIND